MPKFSKKSAERLATCHPDLQKIFNEIIKTRDCTIICGARTLEDQQAAFKGGFSKIDGINRKSKHQISKEQPLSLAVDVLPYPIKWEDKASHDNFARAVKATAEHLGIKVRWGGDFKDFRDAPHYELV
ncbi:MAG: M15 family metallopeptidase [Pelagibacterales bacterium]|nr:M15 family metallopeptidase [Pelagibacterales bacterium]